jgi:ribosomal protein RSM22 (predicted rRNA methylase)
VRTAHLPAQLQRYVDDRLAGGRPAALKRSAGELSERYRSTSGAGPGATDADAVDAYAATRLPATYAAVAVALTELDRIAFAPSSHLDLGTGLGSAVWAAGEAFPSLRRVTAVDAVAAMLAAAAQAAAAGPPAVRAAAFVPADLTRYTPDGRYDLVTAAYALNELPQAAALALLERIWPATGGALVLVEPGTPASYARLMALRARLIALGARILAPCPHDGPCPLQGDWCHFAVRLARSSAHRAAKGGRRGFEDEKFSYVVATRVVDDERARPRILRHPVVRPGHVRFRLCTASGIEERTVARSDPGYRDARKASWGDTALPEQP